MKPFGHIASWLIFAILHFLMLWYLESFQDFFMFIGVICIEAWLIKKWSAILQQWRWMAFFFILFPLIQLMIRNDGQTVLWQFSSELSFGTNLLTVSFQITQEALVETIRSLLQFLGFGMIFIIFEPLLPAKRLLPFLSKWFPNGAQMIYMTLRLVPMLRQRSDRLDAILQTRGYHPHAKRSWKESLRVRMPLLNALLDESLEGAWHRAEAMVARGYGKGPRSLFRPEKWSFVDALIFVPIIFSFFSNSFNIMILFILVPFLFYRIFENKEER